MLEEARKRTGATGAAIAMLAAGGLCCIARSGDTVPELGTRLDPENGLTGLCFRTGKSLLCNDSEYDSRVNPLACRVLNIRSVLVVPLRSKDGSVIGILELLSQDPNAFGKAEFELSQLWEWLLPERNSQYLDQDWSPGQHNPDDILGPALPSSFMPYKAVQVESPPLPHDNELAAKPDLRKSPYSHIHQRGLRIVVAAVLAATALTAYNRELKRFVAGPTMNSSLMGPTSNLPSSNELSQQLNSNLVPALAPPSARTADKAEVLADIKGPVSSISLSSLLLGASAGDAQDQYELGLRYADGAGVPEDYQQAMRWFLSAALKRNVMAEWKLGLGYLGGIGVQRDPRAAAEWLKRAANQNYGAAQLMLSQLYRTGHGVKKDYVRAFTWATIASRSDRRETRQMQEMRASMTPMQLDDANRRIIAWWQNHNKPN